MAYAKNTNDSYIKHPQEHFDQKMHPSHSKALPLLTSEFINPVGVTARKHKIHRPPCSLGDLTVCLSAPPSLPGCSLCSLHRHTRCDNCTASQYDAAGVGPGNCSHQPRRPAVHTHDRNDCNGFQMVCGEYEFSAGGFLFECEHEQTHERACCFHFPLVDCGQLTVRLQSSALKEGFLWIH